ncbi:MAG: hypothetical protein ABSH25_11100 [Syntrophorhabdales bacterium]|jgi:hypothetical protein
MRQWFALSLLSVALAAVCGGYAPVQAEDQTPKMATSIEEIVGTWYTNGCTSPDGCYVRFNADGTTHPWPSGGRA